MTIYSGFPADVTADRYTVELPCQAADPDNWFGGPESDDQKAPRSFVMRVMRAAAEACWIGCPRATRRECLVLGLLPGNAREGVWGGYLPKQRQRMNAIIAANQPPDEESEES